MPDFRVSFGQIARTLLYQDSDGDLCFAFDINPSKDSTTDKWRMRLGTRPVDASGLPVAFGSEAQRRRMDEALERVKQYAAAKGYQVETDES